MEYILIIGVGLLIAWFLQANQEAKEAKEAEAKKQAENKRRQNLAIMGKSPKEIETLIHQDNRKKKLKEILGDSKCPKCKKLEYYPQPITIIDQNFWGENTNKFVNVPICKECNLEFVPRVLLEK